MTILLACNTIMDQLVVKEASLNAKVHCSVVVLEAPSGTAHSGVHLHTAGAPKRWRIAELHGSGP